MAIVDVERGEPAPWIAKSYLVSSRERTLVQDTDLELHLPRFGDERVLVLGCHDLNMSSARRNADLKVESERNQRSRRRGRLANSFKQTIVLALFPFHGLALDLVDAREKPTH